MQISLLVVLITIDLSFCDVGYLAGILPVGTIL